MWCKEAGFKRFEILHLAGPSSEKAEFHGCKENFGGPEAEGSLEYGARIESLAHASEMVARPN